MPSQLAPQTGETESQPVSAWALLPAPPRPDALTSPTLPTAPHSLFHSEQHAGRRCEIGRKHWDSDVTSYSQTKLKRCHRNVLNPEHSHPYESRTLSCRVPPRELWPPSELPLLRQEMLREGKVECYSQKEGQALGALSCQLEEGRTVEYRASTVFGL